jgi:hypothetical protein
MKSLVRWIHMSGNDAFVRARDASRFALIQQETEMIRIPVVTVVATLLATAAVGQTTKTPPAPAASTPTIAAPATPAPPAAPPAHSTASKSAADTSDRFADEASAKAHCADDSVVWLNTSSKVYHLAGTPSYGKTKKGAYMCQKDADQGGFHVAKEEVARSSAAKPSATAPKKP